MPKDLASRISYFYCASALSGSFSGLLAGAIARLDGYSGRHGWQWIFIVEGLVTVGLGFACFVLLIDSPSLSHRWLDQDEIRFLELQNFIKQGGRLQEIQEHARTWTDVKAVLRNWRLYAHGSCLIANTSCSYGKQHRYIIFYPFCLRPNAQITWAPGIKYTLPTITKAMGHSTMKAQFLSAPPYIAGAISALACGKLSDHCNWRMPFVVFGGSFILVGNSILLSLNGAMATSASAVWAAVVVAMIGIYPIQPAVQAWNANNIAPSSRRAVGVALTNSVGNLGGIVGSFMYPESQAPRYETGFGLSLAFGAYTLLMALLLEWSYVRSNARKARMVGNTQHDDADLLAMGDKSPLFKHVL